MLISLFVNYINLTKFQIEPNLRNDTLKCKHFETIVK